MGQVPRISPGLRLLLASSSVAALLIAGGTPAAFAACDINDVANSAGAGPFSNSGSINCINIQNSSVTGGGVTNAAGGTISAMGVGAPSATGITINNSSINGAISNAGTIDATFGFGILVDSNSTIAGGISNSGMITAGSQAIEVADISNFSGGISNAGTISTSQDGIEILDVTTFTGGISNSGMITAGLGAIGVADISNFSGGVSNSGTISGGGYAIVLDFISTFTGGITNIGTVHSTGLLNIAVLNVSSFAEGISNSGTISGSGYAIFLKNISTFAGGISNSGAITSSALAGIALGSTATNGGVSTFTGNVLNSGTISAKTGISIIDSTINGAIVDSGTINASGHGILIDNRSNIVATGTAVSITGPTFTGGISNAGTIASASDNGIDVGASVTSFSGGISNSGAISAKFSGILVDALTFGGGIANSGTIAGGPDGINVVGVTAFSGGIGNSGTISANGAGIAVSSVSSFAGGISNGGMISAGTGAGIDVDSVTSFAGGISNGGMISAAAANGIELVTVTNFVGGISNSGTISAKSSGIFVNDVSAFAGGVSNAGTILGGSRGIIVLNVTTFTGGIGNAGTISSNLTGIRLVVVSSFSGGISNGGTISSATGDGIAAVQVASFAGGISNSGALSAKLAGIFVSNIATFAGGIGNAGSISAAASGGIFVSNIASFAGGISNAGSISTGGYGIDVSAATFTGGISNSGTLSASRFGILVGETLFGSSGPVPSFAGNISNSGRITAQTGVLIASGVTFAPGSAIVNSGTISASVAAIDVSAATSPVIIDQTGGLISGAIKLSANADVLNISGGTIAGNIVGAGTQDTINFALGAGNTFTYGSAYGFTGVNQVNINSGTVILDGANNAAAIDVLGGTLAGTGTLDPLTLTIHSGATFSPGTPGTPGTSMTIAGNLAFQSGALYVVYLNPSTASFANVTGTASLAGTVDANFAGGSYMAKQYTILESSGVSGTFPGLTTAGLPAGFDASLSYSADDVLLNLTAQLGSGGGLNQNQQNVATGLNTYFNNGGTLPAGFVNLFGLSGSRLGNALSQLDGEDSTGAERGAFDLMNEFLTLLLDPFVDGRGSGSNTGGALGFAPDQQASLPDDIALAYAGLLKAPPPQTFNQRWSAWASGFGGSATTDGDPTVGSNNVTTSTYGYAAGMDYHTSPDTVLGFSLAGGGTNWNLANALGTGRSDAFLAGLYGVTHEGPWYLGGALAFANNWFTTNRTALGDQLTASFQGQNYAARLEGGYRFAVPVYHGAAGVTPYAAIQAQDFQTPAYSETDLTGGGFGLSYNAMNGTDTRSELGSRFDDLTALNNMPLILRARVAWAHDWVSNPALNAAFEALPGTGFTVNGAPIPRDSALTSAGAQLFFTPNWSFLAKFDGEFASGSQLYAGSGTLRYSW